MHLQIDNATSPETSLNFSYIIIDTALCTRAYFVLAAGEETEGVVRALVDDEEAGVAHAQEIRLEATVVSAALYLDFEREKEKR